MAFPPRDPTKPPQRVKLTKQGNMSNRRAIGDFVHEESGVRYRVSFQVPAPPKPGGTRQTHKNFMKKVAKAIENPRGTASLGGGVVLHAQPLPAEPDQA